MNTESAANKPEPLKPAIAQRRINFDERGKVKN